MTLARQRWWLVGASEGLGRALAQAMADDGAEVIVSSRSQDRLQELVSQIGHGRAVAMDVSDPASVREAATEVGPIEGMVYLAGAYWPMDAQDWEGDKIRTMLDVNLGGAVNVLDCVLPAMMERGAGQIALTGSLAGYRGLPGALGYGASKAGLMHLAETLQADLKDSPIVVQQINPGFIRTRLTDKNAFNMPAIMEPDDAAREFLKAIKLQKPHVAFPRAFSMLFRIGRFLPQSVWLKIFDRG